MRRFYRGATIPLEFTHVDFPKSDWTAKLILKGTQNTISFDATPDSERESFLVTISATDSAAIAVGSYQIHYRYESGDGEVSFLPGCEVEFIAAPTETGDHRSQWVRDLEAIDEAIRKKISGGAVEEYEIQTTVGQRSLKNMSLADLRDHRRWVLGRANEERVKAGKKPLGGNRWTQIKSSLGNQAPVRRRRYR
jgi:hypothetical protein